MLIFIRYWYWYNRIGVCSAQKNNYHMNQHCRAIWPSSWATVWFLGRVIKLAARIPGRQSDAAHRSWLGWESSEPFRLSRCKGRARSSAPRPNNHFPASSRLLPRLATGIGYASTTYVSKYKYLLTSTDHVWPFVLFKKFIKILFILLWHVLSSYIFEVYLNYFYFFSNFLNKTNDQI